MKFKTLVLCAFLCVLELNVSQCFSASDSTSVKPLSSPGIMYPATTVSAKPVTNENYPAPCPATFNCRDINGKIAGVESCPDTCSVTRTEGSKVLNRYTSTKDAICPVGYSQIGGAYNMQKEIINKPAQAVTDIDSIATANTYVAAGWVCKPISNSDIPEPPSEYATTCGGGANEDTRGWTNRWGVTYWAFMYDNSDCYFGKNCGGQKQSCSLITTTRLYRYHRIKLVCTSPAGLYESGDKAPISVVCARVAPVWKKQN